MPDSKTNEFNPLLERSQDFILMLYPQEDAKHKLLLDYVTSHDRLFSSVYITHDKDVWCADDKEVLEGTYCVGDSKKEHTHLLVHCKRRWTLGAFLKFFECWVDFAEVCYNLEGTIAYFCHETPNSFNKFHYDSSLLKGDKKLISKVFGQNPYFVQLGEYAEMCRTGANISDIVLEALSIDDINKRKIAMESFDKYSHVICCMSNQEKNDKKSKKYEDAEYYPQVKID